MRTDRKSTIQTVAWVRDMYRARQLELDPPYQRRSVWNKAFKQYFIDTLIKNYPIPPIFVNVEVQEDGSSIYYVVDGKQRLLSIIEFLDDKFPLSREAYSSAALAGKYFSQLDSAVKKSFYGYYLPIEFFTDIKSVFERFLDKWELRLIKTHEGTELSEG